MHRLYNLSMKKMTTQCTQKSAYILSAKVRQKGTKASVLTAYLTTTK